MLSACRRCSGLCRPRHQTGPGLYSLWARTGRARQCSIGDNTWAIHACQSCCGRTFGRPLCSQQGFLLEPTQPVLPLCGMGYVHVREVSMAQCMRYDSEYAACMYSRPPCASCVLCGDTARGSRVWGVCDGGMHRERCGGGVRSALARWSNPLATTFDSEITPYSGPTTHETREGRSCVEIV